MKPSDAFFSGSRYAIFGVEAPGRLHGKVLVAALRKAKKEAVAIEPSAPPRAGIPSAPTLAAAAPVDGVVILPPSPWSEAAAAFTENALRQCADANIHSIWIYPDGRPDEALAIAQRLNLDGVAGVCPCLYIQGAGFPHNLHRWLLRVTGKL